MSRLSSCNVPYMMKSSTPSISSVSDSQVTVVGITNFPICMNIGAL
jgi:hypothetical protein